MEYRYTHGVGGTTNKVKSTTDPSVIGSGVLSMGYGGYFPLGKKGNPFTHGEGGWVFTPPYAQNISQTHGYLLYLN